MRFSCALSSRAVSGPSSPRATRGLVLIALAAVSWGTTGTATTFLVRDTAISPLVIGVAPRFTAGVALALAAGIAYAVYVVIAKVSVTRAAPLPLAAATFFAGAVWLSPTLVWAEPSTRQLALGWPLLLYLGVVTTGLAY